MIAPGVASAGSNVFSPSTWAKQRRSEFKAGQLSHQQSMSVSNMANTVDMDDNERKIVTEFCHYLEKSKQLFNGLRLDKILLVIFNSVVAQFIMDDQLLLHSYFNWVLLYPKMTNYTHMDISKN